MYTHVTNNNHSNTSKHINNNNKNNTYSHYSSASVVF